MSAKADTAEINAVLMLYLPFMDGLTRQGSASLRHFYGLTRIFAPSRLPPMTGAKEMVSNIGSNGDHPNPL
jgi:hypothetical protein